MPPYPGPINDDTPLVWGSQAINKQNFFVPAIEGLSRGGFAWLFGTRTTPQVPASFEDVKGNAVAAGFALPVASVPVAVQIANGLPLESVSIELEFSGAPGAFELDIQDADTNADAFFNQIQVGGTGAKITTVSAANTARFEFNPFSAKFIRVSLISLTNAVKLRVKVSGQ